jgi:hypothetical protein
LTALKGWVGHAPQGPGALHNQVALGQRAAATGRLGYTYFRPVGRLGLTIDDFAQKVGIDEASIRMWNDINHPVGYDLYRICDALDTNIDYLTTGKTDEKQGNYILNYTKK